MSPLRPAALALLAGVLALSACGRKGEPERPGGGERPDPAVTIPMGGSPEDDDPLLEPLPEPVTPGPRLEERVDEDLPG